MRPLPAHLYIKWSRLLYICVVSVCPTVSSKKCRTYPTRGVGQILTRQIFHIEYNGLPERIGYAI